MTVYRPIDVAKRWHCSERHVRNLLNAGELRGFKAGGKLWRIRGEWVEEYEICQSGALDGTGESSSPSPDQETAAADIRSLRIARKLNGSSTS